MKNQPKLTEAKLHLLKDVRRMCEILIHNMREDDAVQDDQTLHITVHKHGRASVYLCEGDDVYAYVYRKPSGEWYCEEIKQEVPHD